MNGLSFANMLLAILAVVALWGGWLAMRQATRTRQAAGLPSGRIIYADTGGWRPPDAPFFSAAYGLTGKPDYLVETRAGLIPIEVKSSAAPSHPYSSHVLQLAAYCLLVEETGGQAPPYGLIKYADDIFEVDYTPALRRELLALLDAMQRLRAQNARQGAPNGVPRSHDEPRRCAGCAYRPMCKPISGKM
jgi:CRISPR-associated exonuclease Cas4